MSIAEQTTLKIRGVIDKTEVLTHEDCARLATRYQEYCVQANQRLQNVSDLIRKNMVSEALRLAETEPPLLELCAELDFVGAEKWREMCARQGWATPEPLLGTAINLLNDAYASGSALEPLLKEYRKAVREGVTVRVVRILRRVAKLDAKNKTWIEDLRRFEHKRLEEIQAELQALAQVGNKESLLQLLGELDEYPAENNETSRLRKAAAARLKDIYMSEASVRGIKLITAFSAAYTAQDMAQAELIVQEYHLLKKEGYFQPSANLQIQYDEAMAWLQQEQKKRDEESLYEHTLDVLAQEVEAGRAGKLNDLLNQLARLNRSIPELLENRARLLLEHHDLERERRRRLIIAMAAGALLLVGVGLTYAIMHYQFRKEVAAVEDELVRLFKATDRVGYETYLTSLESNKNKIFRTPSIQQWVAKKAELLRNEEQAQTTCHKALARLDAVRQGGFLEDRVLISNLVNQAKTSAIKGEDISRITLFVADWAAYQQKARASMDTDLTALLAQLGDHLPGTDAFSTQIPEDLKQKITTAQGLLEQAGKIGETSPELLLQLNTFKAKYNELAKGMEARQELLSGMVSAPSLYDYLEMIRKYAMAFPSDSLSKHFEHWLVNEALYKEFAANISPDLSNRVWNATAGELAQHDKRLKEKWTEIQGAITSVGEDKELVDLHEYTYLVDASGPRRGERVKIYFKGQPRESTSAIGRRILGGLAYEPQAQDQQALFKTKTIPADLVEGGRRMAHCGLINNLISEAGRTTAEQSDLFLLNKMSELQGKNNVPALLRLRLISFLMDRFWELSRPSEGSTWNLLAGKFKGVDQDLSWLCMNNQAVLAAGQKAEKILADGFADSRAIGLYRAEWMFKRAALNRTVQWAGFAPFKAGAPAIKPIKRAVRELWVIRPISSLDLFDIRVWEEQRGAEIIHYEEALPGEPLFAPIATTTTRTLLQEIRTATGVTDLTPAMWKSTPWPTNLRD